MKRGGNSKTPLTNVRGSVHSACYRTARQHRTRRRPEVQQQIRRRQEVVHRGNIRSKTPAGVAVHWSGAAIVSVLWRHGPRNLIAYLNTRQP